MFDIFKVVSQYRKLSEDVYKLSREVSLLNNRLDNKEREENTKHEVYSCSVGGGQCLVFSMMKDVRLEIGAYSGNNDVKHITMYSHDIEKLKELLNECTDSQRN